MAAGTSGCWPPCWTVARIRRPTGPPPRTGSAPCCLGWRRTSRSAPAAQSRSPPSWTGEAESALDRAGEAVDEETLQQHEENDDRHERDDGASTQQCPLCRVLAD